MKKIALYGLLLSACVFAGCDGDYDDWADPQGYDAEDAVTISFTAAAVSAIDMSTVTADSIAVFSSTVSIPDSASVSSYKVVLDNSVELTANSSCQVSVADLTSAVTTLYGKRPEARTMTANISIYVSMNDNVVTSSSSTSVTVTLNAPEIADAYYLVSDWAGWTEDTMEAFSHSGSDVYEDPEFTITFTTTGDNQYWKIIPQTSVDAGNIWADPGVVGVATDGDTSMSGSLINEGAQAGKIETAGMYRMTINMMDYTYEIVALAFSDYYYEIGNESGWATSNALYGANNDGIYYGYYYLNGEFKFKPNADDWNDDLEYMYDGAGTSTSGNLSASGDGNCPDPGEGFYQIYLDAASMNYTLTEITSISIIGTVNGNWDADTDLTYNTETGAWEATTELAAGEMKFRMNYGWDYSWGGVSGGDDYENLTEYSGANLTVGTAGTYLVQLFLSCEGSHYCTLTAQ